MLHHIQKSIIESLGFQSSLRYSELKPSDLDGNVFGYHLKQAILDNYVTRSEDGSYQLAPAGREWFIRRFENDTTSAHSNFLVIVKNGDSYLLRRRKVQPLLGKSGFLHGEPTPSMPTIEAARQRLKQKTGLIIPLDVRASALIAQYQDDQLVSYSHAIILYGETTDDILISSDETGENFWSDSLGHDDILPSCSDIIELVASGRTWVELTYRL